MKKVIVIGSETFASKRAAEDRIREILYAYPFEVPLRVDDLHFMLGVLQLHPEAEKKIGVGIEKIIIEPEFRGSRHFTIVRTDGGREDFSFKKCLTHPTLEQDFRRACRTAVVPQIIEFKNKAFNRRWSMPCAITGKDVSYDTCHIDHAPPYTFEEIVREFLVFHDPMPIDPEGGIETRFTNPDDASLFAEFHRTRAILQVVDPVANMSRKR